MAITTNGLQLARIAGAVFNQQLSASDYSEILASNKTAAELDAWANAAVAAEFRNKTTTDIAKAVLANVGLSEVTGLEAWVAGQLTAGGGVAKAGATMLAMLNDFSNMTSDATYGAAASTFNQKAANSQVLSQTAGTPTGTYAAVSAGAPAKTFTLTTSIENAAGGAGSDSINGFINVGSTTSNTLQSGDNIDGGAATDTLAVSITGTAGTTSVNGVTVVNVEKLQVQNTSSAGQTFDTVLTTGASTMSTYGSSAAVTFSNIKNLVNGEMAYGSSDLTLTYAASVVSGSSDAMTLSLNGQSAGTFSTTGIETLTVSTSGNAVGTSAGNVSIGTTNTATVANVNATISSFLTLSDTSLKTINASGSTASLTLDIATPVANQTVTVTGGSGNDTVTATGAAATDTINLGDGTDTLVFTTTTGTTDLPLVTGVERVRVNATDTAGGVLDGTVVAGTTAFVVSMVDGTDNATDTTIAISDLTIQSVEVVTSTKIAADTDANILTVAHKTDTAADSLSLILSGIGNSTTAALTSFTANDAETISIAANLNSSGSTTSNLVTSLASTDVTSITVTGAGALEIRAVTAANLATVDASATTRAQYLDTAGGKSSGVSVTGGSANDTIDGGTGNDSINGGSGNDTLATGAGGNDVVSGGDGDDRIVVGSLSAGGTTETLDQTGGNLNLTGGAGNDTFAIASDMLGWADSVTGGDGTDILEINRDATTTTLAYSKASTGAFRNVDVENIRLVDGDGGAMTITINDAGLTSLGTTFFSATGAQAHAVDASGVLGGGGAVKFDASASTMTGAAVYTGGAANDHFLGGSAANTVNIGNAVYLNANDTLSGGANVDELIFSSTTAGAIVSAQLTNVAGFEVIQLDADTGTAAATAMSITVTDAQAVANRLDATNTWFIVRENATVNTAGAYTQTGAGDDTSTTTINGSAVTSGTKLYLVGAAGADTLTGGSANDTINGAAGADSLIGGDGSDSIVGGAGADTISGGAGNDTLEGGAGIDSITLEDGVDRVNYTSGGTAAAAERDLVTGFKVYGVSTSSTFTGDSGYDFIAIDEDNGGADFFGDGTFTEATVAGATLAAGNFQSIDGSTTDADIDATAITVIWGEGYADFNAMAAANTVGANGANTLVTFFNTSTQRAELWYTTDADNSGADEFMVIALVGVTMSEMQGLTRQNFLIVE
jgi:Ca2+-binding RTX toxin-like protein